MSLVWIPDKQYEWILAEIISQSGDNLIVACTPRSKSCALGFQTSDTLIVDSHNIDKIKIQKRLTCEYDSSHIENPNDLCSLNAPSEGPVLNILRRRFLEDKIYTHASDILISINPYKDIPGLYQNPLSYANSVIGPSFKPHLYVVANSALSRLSKNSTYLPISKSKVSNQSIIIAGESGSGKTEASKRILSFIVQADEVRKRSFYQTDKFNDVKGILLNSIQLLEAFGNAKTLQNDNSSRFGQYIKLNYNEKNVLVSASINSFLLEKSRLVSTSASERNYHIFYHFLSGIDQIFPETKSRLMLSDNMNEYSILTANGLNTIESSSRSADEIKAIYDALLVIGVPENEITKIWDILAVILHLGNTVVSINSDRINGSADISFPTSSAENISSLLGVDPQALEPSFLSHSIVTKARHSFKVKYLTPTEAKNNISALMKWLYSSVFSYLLHTINATSKKQKSSDVDAAKYISILDIFGFEILATNSFEQLCINYTNERLHQHFIEFVFAADQELYVNEKISWTAIQYTNNDSIIDLIAKKPIGLLNILEEHCLLNRTDDLALLSQYHQTHGKSTSVYVKPRFGNDPNFTIKHFSGSVTYCIDGFISKNNDSLQGDLSKLLLASSNPFILKILELSMSSTTATPRLLSPQASGQAALASTSTVSLSLRMQIDSLISELKSTQPFYIKCIKPNSTKSADVYDIPYVLNQLKNSSVIDLIQMRKERFYTHLSFKEFYSHYEVLLRIDDSIRRSASDCRDDEAKEYCKYLVSRYLSEYRNGDIQFGKTKIFLKENPYQALQTIVSSYTSKYATVIQKHIRRYLVYSSYQEHLRYVAQQKANELTSINTTKSSFLGKLFSQDDTMFEDGREDRKEENGLTIITTLSPAAISAHSSSQDIIESDDEDDRPAVDEYPIKKKYESTVSGEVFGISPHAVGDSDSPVPYTFAPPIAVSKTNEPSPKANPKTPAKPLSPLFETSYIAPSLFTPSPTEPEENVFEKYIEDTRSLRSYSIQRSQSSSSLSPLSPRFNISPSKRGDPRFKSPHRIDEERRIRREVERRRQEDILRRAEESRIKFEEDVRVQEMKMKQARRQTMSEAEISGSNPLANSRRSKQTQGSPPLEQSTTMNPTLSNPSSAQKTQSSSTEVTTSDSSEIHIRRNSDSLQNRLEAERLRRKQAEKHRKNIEFLSKKIQNEKDEEKHRAEANNGWNTFVEQTVNDITHGVTEITTGLVSGFEPLNEWVAPAAEWTQPMNSWFSGLASTWGAATEPAKKK